MCKYKKVLETTVPPQSVGLSVFEIKPKNLAQQDLYWIGQCCLNVSLVNFSVNLSKPNKEIFSDLHSVCKHSAIYSLKETAS